MRQTNILFEKSALLHMMTPTMCLHRKPGGKMPLLDRSHKSHHASDKYPTMHHFIKEICAHSVQISVTKWCTVGYGTGLVEPEADL